MYFVLSLQQATASNYKSIKSIIFEIFISSILIYGQISGAFISPLSTFPKYFFWKYKATLTSEIKTGTSTKGPITAANASPELIPNTAIATAIANSKLLLAAVNDSVAD